MRINLTRLSVSFTGKHFYYLADCSYLRFFQLSRQEEGLINISLKALWALGYRRSNKQPRSRAMECQLYKHSWGRNILSRVSLSARQKKTWPGEAGWRDSAFQRWHCDTEHKCTRAKLKGDWLERPILTQDVARGRVTKS